MKKHLFFLGKAGTIYYSWLMVLLFISLIIALEGNKAIMWPAVIIGSIFLVIAIYTFLCSYIKEEKNSLLLKLPYKKKVVLTQKPQKVASWHAFHIYHVELSKYEAVNYMIIQKTG
ncbi:EbsA family protein [Lactobacillus jensenii]|uniref:EbsA family protein n=1 Tax=Lactobacillus jensenii TaxID=109790 RepID=UPI001F08E206|nr:EbsA family protein [Lactobacillus jensenii]